MLHACGCLLQCCSSTTTCQELKWHTATSLMLLMSCCLLMTAGEGHKMHSDSVKASEAAVHKGAAESSLHDGSTGEKGVVDKGSHGANPTIGEAFDQLLWSLPNCSVPYHLTPPPPLTHLKPIP